VLNNALKAVEATILAKKGTYKLVSEPKVFGDKVQETLEVLENQKDEENVLTEDSEVEGMGDADEDEEIVAADVEEEKEK